MKQIPDPTRGNNGRSYFHVCDNSAPQTAVALFENFLGPFVKARKAEKRKKFADAARLYRQASECLQPTGAIRHAIEEKATLCERAAIEPTIIRHIGTERCTVQTTARIVCRNTIQTDGN